MSRVAKNPIQLPEAVNVTVDQQQVTVKGPKGAMPYALHPYVRMVFKDNSLIFDIAKNADPREAWMQAGTARAQLNNRVVGVSVGYERKLKLVGVGYQSELKGQVLVLKLGFSHLVHFPVPEGIVIEVSGKQGEEITLRGIDKQQVNQAAANIRQFRKPEPYKGKGVRYDDETIVLKEVKKK